MDLSDSWANRQPATTRVGAAEAVLADLRTSIERGDLPVGTTLPAESALATRYGVSRSVVREALRTCAALRLTETHTGKGTIVIANRAATSPTFGKYSIAALREARPHVEVPAAGYAALRRTDAQLARLRELHDLISRETDPDEWVRLDAAFHLQIAQASGNEVFAAVVRDIRGALADQSKIINDLAGRQQPSLREHAAIVDAIASGVYEDAANAMAEHLHIIAGTTASLFPDR
jgi:GntR family transcriptional repressor for pyruvate dehydrogenase complex